LLIKKVSFGEKVILQLFIQPIIQLLIF